MTLANQRKERINFTFPVRVDKRGEWEQLFEESWRVMKYRFYDPKMHGKDWDAAKAKYKPLLRHAGANEDVYALANEMIGELNASHTGVSGPSSACVTPPTRAPMAAPTTGKKTAARGSSTGRRAGRPENDDTRTHQSWVRVSPMS